MHKVWLVLTVVSVISGVEYGPSISSLTGVLVSWKGPDLLSIESGKKVRLENYPGFSATLPLITGSASATSEQIFKERGISTLGEFLVEAPKGFGIIVVVQELKLRKTLRERGNLNSTTICSDYIQIGELRSDSQNGVSDKICGIVLKDEISLQPKSLIGPRTLRISSGRIRVAFNHAYVAELVDSLLGSKQKHVLKAEVTFTAFKTNCSTNGTVTPSSSLDGPEEIETFSACNSYKKSVNSTCISSKLFCDEFDIYNCGGDEEILGSDEDSLNCPDKPVRTTQTVPPEDGTEAEEKSNALSDLQTYLGIPSLSSYTTKKYERKFRPSYISGSSGPASSFLNDYKARKSTEIPATSSTTEPSRGSSIEINVIGPSRESDLQSFGGSSATDTTSYAEFDSDIYSRRELAHAINSVIYGVAVFIIFTIFVTVFVVCVTKKIQLAWIARQERRLSSIDPENQRARRVSTPGILPHITTITNTSSSSRRASECPPGEEQEIPETVPEAVEHYEPPPAYDTLFPART